MAIEEITVSEKAIQDFDKALAIRPYPAAYGAYLYLGERRSIQDFDVVIEGAPNFPNGYIGRGDAYYNEGRI